jgi:hypothetical protein
MFTNFKQEVIDAVRLSVKSGLFKKDNSVELKLDILNKLHSTLCGAYNLRVIPLIYDEKIGDVKGRYIHHVSITIGKPSLVTYLHEFYHYKAHMLLQDNTEDDARGWSISLYSIACPILFKQAVDKKLIMYMEDVK